MKSYTQEDYDYFDKIDNKISEFTPFEKQQLIDFTYKHFVVKPLVEEKKYPFIVNFYNFELKLNSFFPECIEVLKNVKGNTIINSWNSVGAIGMVLSEKYKLSHNVCKYFADELHLPLVFLYNWNIYKQVYSFEDNCLEMLMENAEYKEVPIDTLKENLPYDTFFIENKFSVDGEKYRGVVISKIIREDNKYSLGFFFIRDNGEYDYRYAFLPLEEGSKSVEELIDMSDVKYFDLKTLLNKTLSLVLYLCSSNKEIRPMAHKNSYEKNHEKHREKVGVKVAEVGYQIGATIKAIKKSGVEHTTTRVGSHSSKRPHNRCAHYQAYWVGARDSADRHKEIKFIPPLFINGGSQLATLHKVKK